MNLSKKLATTALATGALLFTMAPSVFADVEIVGNGWGSKNTVEYNYTSETQVNQSNETDVHNHVVSIAETGNNSGEDVHTGDATSVVDIEVNGGTNIADLSDCGCPQQTDIGIYGNSGWSHNDVDVTKTYSTKVDQDLKLTVWNGVYSHADTGGNDSSDHENYNKWWWWNNNNNSSDGEVHTGNAMSAVSIAVTSGDNIVH